MPTTTKVEPFDSEAAPQSGAGAQLTQRPGKLLISSFPPEVQPMLKEMDTDGSGTIDAEEFGRSLNVHQQTKRKNQILRKATALLALLVAVLIGANTAISVTIADLAKESKVGGDGVLRSKGGSAMVIQTAIHEVHARSSGDSCRLAAAWMPRATDGLHFEPAWCRSRSRCTTCRAWMPRR